MTPSFTAAFVRYMEQKGTTAMTTEAKYYGVSTGNGNDGVSQMFPDYIVKTDNPWRLAELAALTEFKPGEGQAWAKENMEIDGEADYTIYVTFRESPETQEERQELLDKADELDDRADQEQEDDAGEELTNEADKLRAQAEEYGEDYSWFIIEIFPILEGDHEFHWKQNCPKYESLEECFTPDQLKLVAA